MIETEPRISAKLVPDNERNTFLPNKLPHAFLQFENLCFDTLSQQAKDYGGGYWDFYELSNNGFYIAPSYETLELRVPTNGYRGTMSGDAAGIVASLVALNRLLWANPTRELHDYYYELREFACGHADAIAILGAID
jgi:hypothetical protein